MRTYIHCSRQKQRCLKTSALNPYALPTAVHEKARIFATNSSGRKAFSTHGSRSWRQLVSSGRECVRFLFTITLGDFYKLNP